MNTGLSHGDSKISAVYRIIVCVTVRVAAKELNYKMQRDVIKNTPAFKKVSRCTWELHDLLFCFLTSRPITAPTKKHFHTCALISFIVKFAGTRSYHNDFV